VSSIAIPVAVRLPIAGTDVPESLRPSDDGIQSHETVKTESPREDAAWLMRSSPAESYSNVVDQCSTIHTPQSPYSALSAPSVRHARVESTRGSLSMATIILTPPLAPARQQMQPNLKQLPTPTTPSRGPSFLVDNDPESTAHQESEIGDANESPASAPNLDGPNPSIKPTTGSNPQGNPVPVQHLPTAPTSSPFVPSSTVTPNATTISAVTPTNAQDKKSQVQRGQRDPDKTPHIACQFCRGRKIACVPGPSGDKNFGPCMSVLCFLCMPMTHYNLRPCAKRELDCVKPAFVRRGHKRKTKAKTTTNSLDHPNTGGTLILLDTSFQSCKAENSDWSGGESPLTALSTPTPTSGQP